MQRDPGMTRKTEFLAQNKTLLETGEFSDATVTCQGRTWKLHQAIICPRSKFFHRAFQGQFKEAAVKSIDLEEVDPDLFDYVVHYLYTGDCDWYDLSRLTTNPFLQATQLSIVADYIGLEAMIPDICTYLREYYTPIAALVQGAYRYISAIRPSSIDEISEGFLDMYIEGAQLAFDHPAPGLDPLRATFRRFVSDTAYCVLRDEVFLTGLRECPTLSQSILENLFADGSSFLDIIPREDSMIPPMCHKCHLFNAYPYTATWLVEGRLHGRCKSCQEEVELSGS